ncbi:MAG: T9SS type A sorting domain-containing protein [Bacteroidales bacterium]|nr:T9SS type A sorting domain-containing protein [Bacteroidales bacterium]
MKKLTLILIGIVFTISLFAQWEIKYPDPILDNLNDIFFINETQGWAAGDEGGIIHTEDGGVSWEIQSSEETGRFMSIHFGNINSGWAVASHLIHTQDGGSTWDNIYTFPGDAIAFTSVYGLGDDSCWVTAFGGIYFTANTGLTWEKQDSSSIRSLSFIDNTTGWAVGSQVILKTTNAGNTWEPLPGIAGFNPEKVCFVTPLIGYMVASYSLTNQRVFKTQDGGLTWEIVLAANGYNLDISFQNADTGYAFQAGYRVYMTTNGGMDWDVVFTPGYMNSSYGRSIFADFDKVWLTVGNYNPSNVYFGDNLGDTWIHQFPDGPTHQDLLATEFVNENTGWAVGNNGAVIKTIDGGISWISQNAGINQNLTDIQFLDENMGWVVGDTGIILFTQNGGTDWISQNVPVSENFIDVSFVNENTGWVISNNSLLQTSNGGTNWDSISIYQSNGYFSSICFTSQEEGWLMGAIDGEIGLFKTTDGGISWNLSLLPQAQGGEFDGAGKVIFIDNEQGWILAYLWDILSTWTTGYKTQDGGQSWQSFDPQYDLVESISFFNENHGFVTGYNYIAKEMSGISETFDGGETWESCFEFDFSLSCTSSDISFGNNELAFLVGTKGFIMTWQDPNVSISEIGNNTGMEMNTYPNPVSGLITIEYEAENTTFIKLDIYNQLGQQVYTLFEGKQQQGKQQFSFDVSDLPSGIYFCRLNVGNEVMTRKLVKL